ncbi:lysozyme [Gluconobacter sp. OJB]
MMGIVMISEILDKATNFITSVEGCKLEPYQDSGGVWTCGVGFTYFQGKPVTESYPSNLTIEECHSELEKNVSEIYQDICSLVKVDMSDDQYVSLCSFVYNIGIYAFEHSTMLKLINENKLSSASEQFILWNHVNGVVCNGLTNRRRKEQSLFNGDNE